MSAVEALMWAAAVGAPEVEATPPLPSGAADLLARLNFPIVSGAGAHVRPPASAPGSSDEAA